jgi:cell division septum initiation protein DivIVA
MPLSSEELELGDEPTQLRRLVDVIEAHLRRAQEETEQATQALKQVQERLAQLVQLEEDIFIVGFHQHVHKEREKAYHDRHIKKKSFKKGDLVLVYDSKFMNHSGKF